MRRLWPVDHDGVLVRIYADDTEFTTDQIAFDVRELQRITDLLNNECGSAYDARSVGQRLFTLRKKGYLPRKVFA